ncbi:69c7bc91-c99e-458c-be50-c1d60f1bffba [Thermothielavioides terrestris]|uniref:69c7bc91-c99e-458c-be50-c1d60f1bffba n=1 Tax=Thermothielavioides terrestris TaxID=2587410 RepID=A0A446BKT6_9PEZI|nr:69c7bc91-c99e-458c-be50-c1d60f1bffba [Thermothielavioides terrestris]
MDGKPVACVDEPRAILIFNLAYGTGIFSTELAAVIGPADGDGGNDKDKTSETDDGEAPDEASQRLNELLSQETSGRGHPKALC